MVAMVAVLVVGLLRKRRLYRTFDVKGLRKRPVASCMEVVCQSPELVESLRGMSAMAGREREGKVRALGVRYKLEMEEGVGPKVCIMREENYERKTAGNSA